MKTQAIIAGSVLVVVNGATLIPSLQPYASYAGPASLAVGLWLLARSAMSKESVQESMDIPAPNEESVVTEPVATIPEIEEVKSDADVVTLLAVFQEKGRLVDFLMDDIAAYSDTQVGAAARVVHQGCSDALKKHFDVVPVVDADEGKVVSVPTEVPDGYYRLSGKIEGQPPFSGKLVHKGWLTKRVDLPRVLAANRDSLPVIAPAQVEL